jgi:hypothetical protein
MDARKIIIGIVLVFFVVTFAVGAWFSWRLGDKPASRTRNSHNLQFHLGQSASFSPTALVERERCSDGLQPKLIWPS